MPFDKGILIDQRPGLGFFGLFLGFDLIDLAEPFLQVVGSGQERKAVEPTGNRQVLFVVKIALALGLNFVCAYSPIF